MAVTITRIFKYVGITDKVDEDNIELTFGKKQRESFVSSLRDDQKVKLQKQLFRHFPVLSVITRGASSTKSIQEKLRLENEEAERETVSASLEGSAYYTSAKTVQFEYLLTAMSDMTEGMRYLRDYYTHFNPYNSEEEKEKQTRCLSRISDYLTDAMTSSKRIDKRRKDLSATELEFINNEYVRRNGKFQMNPDFFANMRKQLDWGYTLSDAGVLYFTCLFIEKKYSYKLLDDSGFISQSPLTPEDNFILREIMCIYRMRPAKGRIDSEMTEMALALDMLSELRKCPAVLHKLLSKEAKKEFEQEIAWVDDEPKGPMIRNRDRFATLALRYIDECLVLNNMRFQLQVGKYRFKFYDKICVDGKPQLRTLQKVIHGFGRIQEMEEFRKEHWKDLFGSYTLNKDGLWEKEPDTTETEKYVTNQYAQYNIDPKSNSIGLTWDDERLILPDMEEKLFLPELDFKDSKNQSGTQALLVPKCYISLYELPALVFYHYLNIEKDKKALESITKGQKYNTSVEKVILSYYNGIIKLFNDIKDGIFTPCQNIQDFNRKLSDGKYGGISANDVPVKLRKYLAGENLANWNVYESLIGKEKWSKVISDNSKTESERRLIVLTIHRLQERRNSISDDIKYFKEKHKIVGTKQNKLGSKHQKDIRAGSLAKQLVKDILQWQPDKKKLTGLNYQVMQSVIAMFGQGNDVSQLKHMFAEAHILKNNPDGSNNPNRHPFIDEVLEGKEKNGKKYPPVNTEDFYVKYLTREIEEIDHILNHIKASCGSEKALKRVPFMHRKRIRWSEINELAVKNQAERYLKTPVQLPSGMFTPFIFQQMQTLATTNNSLAKELDGKDLSSVNASYLIRRYFELVENDHAQYFYDATRVVDGKCLYGRKYELFEMLDKDKKAEDDLYMSEKQIRDRLSIKTGKNGGKSKLFGEDGRPLKDVHGNQCYQRNIDNEIQAFVKNVRKKGLYGSIDEAKSMTEKKLKNLVNKCKETEKAIHRFIVQDFLLMAMSREILRAETKDNSSYEEFKRKFSLKNATNEDFLKQEIDFKWPVEINMEIPNPEYDKDRPQEGVKKTIKVRKIKVIRQEDMMIKKYGEFYKFAKDPRLKRLLYELNDDEFSKASIDAELSRYDQQRTLVFLIVHQLESEVFLANPNSIFDDPNADVFYCNNSKYKLDKSGNIVVENGKKVMNLPKLCNFKALLEELDNIPKDKFDKLFNKEERDLVISIRNAFGHNSYNIDFSKIKIPVSELKIPEIANSIVAKLKSISGYSTD